MYLLHRKNIFSRAVKMHIFSRLNRAVILKQSLFPDTGNTTLCCRKLQSAWASGTAASTATSPREASGHHVLLTSGGKSLLSLVSHPWPIPVGALKVLCRVRGQQRVPESSWLWHLNAKCIDLHSLKCVCTELHSGLCSCFY